MLRELLTPENVEYIERAKEIAETVMRPKAAEYDQQAEYPWEVQKAIKEAGLSGVWIPKEYGGEGGGVMNLCLVVEQFSRACGGMGVGYAVNALGSFPILLGGTDEQKERWLNPIARGEKLISFGLSEKNAGSDAGGMETTAVLEHRRTGLLVQHDLRRHDPGPWRARHLGHRRRGGHTGLPCG